MKTYPFPYLAKSGLITGTISFTLLGCQSLASDKNDTTALIDLAPQTVDGNIDLEDKDGQSLGNAILEVEADEGPDISHKYKYKVRGKQYKVFRSSKNFQQIGTASWYGPGFHGKKTANGEVYNMHAMTAAHKTLPLGCKVQVTNLRNGKKIVVRINDRGPFHGGRVIDLSKTAAKKLGMLNSGHTKVHIKIID